ncbi:ImmA/IrrE family metallo-endopeptidase [Aurantiacibacter xanthus]|uniref:ImmA/IrrE family metallo-endopeptidase n=1 Tax=Aurantiacibacter xanthus TaxID=1784712 RepID=A0A3A1P476_9SPHN|nr:ImmA/IrrE family metallo-endopeptidase [Aurantiacibacter xanthus]
MSPVTTVRTEAQYEKMSARLAKLIASGGPGEEIELLSLVLEDYERKNYEIEAPTPLAAIRFRMKQASLAPRDLEPFIGSRSRVSEVLSGTRSLSLDMIRALNRHLGIPADALIKEDVPQHETVIEAPSVHAIRKLRDLGVMKAKEEFEAFMVRMIGPGHAPAFLRKSRTERTNAKTDQAALTAWLATVRHLAGRAKVSKPKKKMRGAAAGRRLAQLSTLPDGPKKARELLREWGIALVTLEHLPGTYLDGAAMRRNDGVDIIAMTLRHDRLDNFWFTLLHEFCHVSEHLAEDTPLILDDLDLRSSEEIEEEADLFAQDALIPRDIWKKYVTPEMSTEELELIARKAKVHVAIVAGRWQREHSDYRRFAKKLGRGEVRRQFENRT